ncbi:hypothetical protein HK104_002335 [Borealophlyctis nickersoniae]|nr:hypothetical protein HK104_002335 [Borealophlyctis nickersoniae]
MEKFRTHVNKKYSLHLRGYQNYDDLWKWSVDKVPDFWATVWEYCKVKASVPYGEVVDVQARIDSVPKWFTGSRLNFAENMLSRRDDHIALIGTREDESFKKVTYAQLHEMVRVCSLALRKAGIKPGDRVAGYVPNSPETVAIMLAAASAGAIWSSASPDFGIKGVLERFSQIKPRILFSVNAVHYNGRAHDHLSKLQNVVQGLPSLEKVVVFPFVDEPFTLAHIPKAISYDEFLSSAANDASELKFEQLPFDHPLVILYSSGTTAGGVLLQHLKEHIIHGNMSDKDVFFYYVYKRDRFRFDGMDN